MLRVPVAGPVIASTALPQRLAAPEPGWTDAADIVVIGSGIAGLTAALRCREAGRVLVVTKDVIAAGSTQWAQGGIAAALGPGDTPERAPPGHAGRRRRAVRRATRSARWSPRARTRSAN